MHDFVHLVPFTGPVVEHRFRAGKDEKADIAGDLRLFGIDTDRTRIAPVEIHRHLTAGERRADVARVPAERSGRSVFRTADIVLESLEPAGIGDLGVHGIGIEEHRARIVGMVHIGRGMAEEEPELLTAADEGLRRAPELLVGPGEELGDIVILVPGLGRGQIVAVFLPECGLLVRVLEEIPAIGAGMHVTVDRLRHNLAVPDHQPVAIDGCDILPRLPLTELLRHFREKRCEITLPGRCVLDHIEGMLAGGHRRHVLGVEFTKGKGDHSGRTTALFLPGLRVGDRRPADEWRVEAADRDLDTFALGSLQRRLHGDDGRPRNEGHPERVQRLPPDWFSCRSLTDPRMMPACRRYEKDADGSCRPSPARTPAAVYFAGGISRSGNQRPQIASNAPLSRMSR